MNRRNCQLNASALTVALAVGVVAGSAHGAENYWTNSNGTNRWAESGNWSLGRVPNSTDHAIIAWGTNSTSVIIDAFCQCGSFTNANNQTIIAGNGYLRIHGGAHIAGGLWMYGTYPVLETLGSASILNSAQLYSGALRQGSGAAVYFEAGCVTTFPAGTPGVSFEGGSIVNRGEWAINNGGISLGKFNDADALTVLENAVGGVIRFNNPGTIFDPSSGNHNGGNSVFINRWRLEAPSTGYNVIESDIQYWVLDWGATVARGNAFIDIKSPVNLDPSGSLDRGEWFAYDNSAIVFAGGGRFINEIGAGAVVSMNGPTAHVYGIDQVTSIKGRLTVDGGKQLLLQPPAPLTLQSGVTTIGAGSSITLWQSLTQVTGVIYRKVANAADMQNPAFNVTGIANVYGTGQVQFLDPALAAVNSLTKLVSAQQGVGGAFAGLNMNGPANTSPRGHYTNNDAYLRVGPACEGDLNADGTVNTADLVMFLGQFGTQRPAMFDGADFNGDTFVTTPDLVLFLGKFGNNCL